MRIEDGLNYDLVKLKNQIQSEYNAFVETDHSAELTDEELVENFWSNAICEYNDNHSCKYGFVINNGIVELVEY